MAAIINYGTLKDAAKQWLNRSDQSAIDAIPSCIGFAEQDFHRTFRLPSLEKNYEKQATSLEPDTIGKIVLPDDYYEAKHLTINGKSYARVNVQIFNKIKQGDFDDVTSDLFVQQGNPNNGKYFCRIGETLYTIPEIVEGDYVQLIYWEDLEPQIMVIDTDSPESIKFGPDIMLYLTLRHASLFLRDNEQAQFWEQKAAEAGSRLVTRLDEIEWSGSTLTEYILK